MEERRISPAKLTIGIIMLVVSLILIIKYISGWVADNPYEEYEEDIEFYEYIIDECDNGIDDCNDFIDIYGYTSAISALKNKYLDLKSEALYEIRSAQDEIRSIRIKGLALIIPGIICVVGGIILLVKSKTTSEAYESEYAYAQADSTWRCPKCNEINTGMKCYMCGTDKYGNANMQMGYGAPTVNGWTCLSCGRINPNYVGTCGCGRANDGITQPQADSVNGTNRPVWFNPEVRKWKCSECGRINTDDKEECTCGAFIEDGMML